MANPSKRRGRSEVALDRPELADLPLESILVDQLADAFRYEQSFRNCELRNADLSQARLRGVDLRGSTLDGIKVEPNQLSGLIIDSLQSMALVITVA